MFNFNVQLLPLACLAPSFTPTVAWFIFEFGYLTALFLVAIRWLVTCIV
jgi:hypothetical protein